MHPSKPNAVPNRLAKEASPYLVQHSMNPVDWHPWGKEALDLAVQFDKPILLSIGYSACHWCHVMERECFEDPAIAELMNAEFVCIKVDREERPDLDQIYQLVVQLLRQGGGGWPLTVFLTSDQKPFFGGTYFPPVDKHGLPAFPRVLRALADSYRNRRSDVHEQSKDLVDAMTHILSSNKKDGKAASAETLADKPGEVLVAAVTKIAGRMDPVHGGFAGKPKFPNTMAMSLLLMDDATGDGPARTLASRTLDAMREGGIYDQVGFGFHRYSTDDKWLVPHFEKMLYDNALLMRFYTDGFKVFGHARYAETVREIAAYVKREMTSPEGAFYSTQDADSEGVEGKFFVWTAAELATALGGDDEAVRVARAAYGVTDEGNFEHSNASVLSRADAETVAKAIGRDEKAVAEILERARLRLFAAREKRTKPFRDEKVLASWNGLLIGALAHAGAVFADSTLVRMAERALDSLVARLGVDDGTTLRLHRLYKGDVVRGDGLLDDYAYVADAALDLYESSGAPKYVRLAEKLAAAMVTFFRDDTDGGFFFTPKDGERLLVRAKDLHDHAIPNAAAVASRVLLRLGALLGGEYSKLGEQAVASLTAVAAANPLSMSEALKVALDAAGPPMSIVLVGNPTDPALKALAVTAHRAPLVQPALRTVAWLDPKNAASIEVCQALAEGKERAAMATAYVCRNFACSPPVSQPDELAELLRA